MKTRLHGNFTQVPNALILDKELSDGAKILWIYIESKSDTWKFYDRNIMKETGLIKRTLQRRRLELVEAGYILVQQRVGETGAMTGMDYYMFDKRGDRKAYAEKIKGTNIREIGGDTGDTGEGDTGDTGTGVTDLTPLSNTNINTNLNVATAPVATKVDDVASVEISESMKEAIEISEYLATKLLSSIDNYKAPTNPTISAWAKDIDRAIRLDNRTKQQLIEKINWIHNGGGSFWIGNIKSGKKLRDQFDTLTAQQTKHEPVKPIRDRVLEAFGDSKVFFKFIPQGETRETHLCIFGEYKALYDYRANKYLEKEKADKMWPFIESNFDAIVQNYKGGNKLWNPKQ